ncbi:mitochondrial pyruvate carrier [Citrus sinensis]|uniref:Mitochondrial pyruvate carrier n=1 Tax=Citrus sinensis TaxID=2711 RepID=A0ACB8KFV0_CITSI|nr:mitochondrial pyruvate carrier [Citrus sinensis]
MSTNKLLAFWNHPAGPKTIHFWVPTFKWGISIANIADFSNYNMKNWNLFSVNFAMARTGLYQLSHKIKQDYFSESTKIEAAAVQE